MPIKPIPELRAFYPDEAQRHNEDWAKFFGRGDYNANKHFLWSIMAPELIASAGGFNLGPAMTRTGQVQQTFNRGGWGALEKPSSPQGMTRSPIEPGIYQKKRLSALEAKQEKALEWLAGRVSDPQFKPQSLAAREAMLKDFLQYAGPETEARARALIFKK